jgi:hypothetical protein
LEEIPTDFFVGEARHKSALGACEQTGLKFEPTVSISAWYGGSAVAMESRSVKGVHCNKQGELIGSLLRQTSLGVCTTRTIAGDVRKCRI